MGYRSVALHSERLRGAHLMDGRHSQTTLDVSRAMDHCQLFSCGEMALARMRVLACRCRTGLGPNSCPALVT